MSLAYFERDILAIDCEMVEAMGRSGDKGPVPALCRVSIVSCSEERGMETRMDTWVETEGLCIVDFRSAITGLDADTFAKKTKMRFSEVRDRVRALIAGRILIGHALWNDLEVLRITHPESLIRDTAMYVGLRPRWRRDRLPSLKMLASTWLKKDLHRGQHDSVEDATVALRLYKRHQVDWEAGYGNRVMANCFHGGTSGVRVIPQQSYSGAWPYGVVPPLSAVQQAYIRAGYGFSRQGLQDWQRALELQSMAEEQYYNEVSYGSDYGFQEPNLDAYTALLSTNPSTAAAAA